MAAHTAAINVYFVFGLLSTPTSHGYGWYCNSLQVNFTCSSIEQSIHVCGVSVFELMLTLCSDIAYCSFIVCSKDQRPLYYLFLRHSPFHSLTLTHAHTFVFKSPILEQSLTSDSDWVCTSSISLFSFPFISLLLRHLLHTMSKSN